MSEYKEAGLFNDWTFVTIRENPYGDNDELLFNRDGSVDFDLEDGHGQGTVSMCLTFEQVERAYRMAKAMKEYYDVDV